MMKGDRPNAPAKQKNNSAATGKERNASDTKILGRPQR